MSFEQLQLIRELQQRVAILEETLKRLALEQKKTLSLPKDSRNKVN